MVFIIIVLVLPSTRFTPSAMRRTQCFSNLKQIAIALHNYHDKYDSLPPAYTVDSNGKPLHSWRTLILPYLEQTALYNSIDLSKPWSDPVNAEAFKTTPQIYRCPSADLPPNYTGYLGVAGENGSFHPTNPRARSEITDGLSNTLMVIEVPQEKAVPWMSPQDADEHLILSISEKDTLAHTGGYQAAIGDGSVRFLSINLDLSTLRAIISISGQEDVGEF